jgi:hypothetical protein
MLIDRYLPAFDFNEVHSRVVHAPAGRVYEALMTADFRRPMIIRILMGLRSLPGRLSGLVGDAERVTLRNVDATGFTLLGEDPPREILVGVEGKFWTLVPDMCSAESTNFEEPVPESLARAVWNFSVEPLGESRSLLRTETRIQCGDEVSRRRFARYWILVRPGSGLIRKAILRHIARTATHDLVAATVP